MKTFVSDWPYELWSLGFPEHFLRNMNIGVLLAQDGMVDADGLRAGMAGDLPVIWLKDPREPETQRSYKEWVRSLAMSSHRLPDPLPFVYVQDRVVECSFEEQARRLVGTDLRLAACVDVGAGRGRDGGAGEQAAEQRRMRFAELQRVNRIVDVDRSRSNRLTVQVDFTEPAMLVVAQVHHPGWQAAVDGKAARVQPVNALQQGIWLEAGPHTVVLKFRPRGVVWGAVVSGLSLVILVIVWVGGGSAGRLSARLSGRCRSAS